MKLPLKFYDSPTLTVARDLLGKVLVADRNGAITAGEIIETEAYTQDDPASHSFRGVTERTKPMFGPPGFAYVYFVYGMYHCVNVVTESPGRGAAVLIRALRPVRGIDVMRRRLARKQINKKIKATNNELRLTNNDLCNGPGKLCLAMAIGQNLNGENLTGERIYVLNKPKIKDNGILITGRIGIGEGRYKPWRFVMKKWAKV